jgi:hypothetical protein
LKDGFKKNYLKKFNDKIKEEEADELAEIENQEEIDRKNKIMARFRLQIEKPYWSDNIYLELNITNLKYFYDRAKKELRDINDYFGITDTNEEIVTTEVLPGFKKTDERIEFEERCYITKLTFKDVLDFLEMQKQRIRDIEEVIDSHFNSLKKEILRNISDKLYRAMKKDQEE